MSWQILDKSDDKIPNRQRRIEILDSPCRMVLLSLVHSQWFPCGRQIAPATDGFVLARHAEFLALHMVDLHYGKPVNKIFRENIHYEE